MAELPNFPSAIGVETARAQRLPLVTHRFEIGGRSWRIRAVADQNALLDAAVELDAFPFGLMLWESSLVLARWMSQHGSMPPRRTVLELGCGVGLAGLAAAAAGASVVQTDHSLEALALAAENADLNSIGGVLRAPGDWTGWNEPRRFQCIIGADILYEPDVHGVLLEIFAGNLAEGGRIVLADPGRSTTPGFLARARACGWDVRQELGQYPALAPVHAGQLVEVSIIELSRA